MLPFQLVYSSEYYLPLGAHVFPGEKYRMVHDHVLQTGIASKSDFVDAPAASDDDMRLVHTPEYVKKLTTFMLSPEERALLEVPWSDEVKRGFWAMTGGSIYAARQALRDGICCNLGGGFHHAYPGHGEGFCAVNDIAVAIRCAQRDGVIQRAMVVDCDVHQGNGTAAIFPSRHSPSPAPSAQRHADASSERDVFTISLHQERNYPAIKPKSSIDVNLPDGIGDAEYLGWLEQTLSSGLRTFTPQLLCYVAGADPYREDQLGGLNLTLDGLKQRDALVFRIAKSKNIPVMVTYAGGYARDVRDTVTIHCNTIVAAREVWADHGATSC